MRKPTILLVALLLGSVASTFAQTAFGIKAGANLAYQTTYYSDYVSREDKTKNSKNLFAYHAGLFLRKGLTKKFSLHTEANFTVAGARLLFIAPDASGDSLVVFYANQKIGYIEVPLLLEYSLARFRFGAGPGISYKLFAKTKLENADDKGDYIENFGLAANMIAGVQLTKKWGIDIRYTYGLRNVNRKGYDVDRKGRVLMLSALYAIK